MEANAIDHVNLHVPEDGVEDALEFYEGTLGFERENFEEYESGDKPFFSIRLAETAVLHLLPSEDFERPDDRGFDHVAIALDQPIEAVTETLRERGVDIERELDQPVGAVGTSPSVYVRDPFGYRLELKATAG